MMKKACYRLRIVLKCGQPAMLQNVSIDIEYIHVNKNKILSICKGFSAYLPPFVMFHL
jgi:hypothetical protein